MEIRQKLITNSYLAKSSFLITLFTLSNCLKFCTQQGSDQYKMSKRSDHLHESYRKMSRGLSFGLISAYCAMPQDSNQCGVSGTHSQQIVHSQTVWINRKSSKKNFNSIDRPYDDRIFNPLDTIAGTASPLAPAIYIFVFLILVHYIYVCVCVCVYTACFLSFVMQLSNYATTYHEATDRKNISFEYFSSLNMGVYILCP